MDTMTVKMLDEDDNEVEVAFPAKYEVCWKCEGHGTHLNPSIGEHAYTPEEFNESFDDEETAQYFKRGGIYDVQCVECEGKRALLSADEACMTADQKNRWAAHAERQERDAAERRAELRMGY